MVEGDSIGYTLKKSSRARGVSITVQCDGSVFVTVPLSRTEEDAENFVHEKYAWIRRKVEYFLANPLIGVWKKQGIGTKRHFKKNRSAALSLVTERLVHWNTFYGFEYKRVSVKNQSSRWGSCSRRKNLNFNYRILFLREELRDYLLVHELCHLGQLNHSKKYWDLVAKTIPDYKRRRNELKRISL